jgi:predicted ATP-grasp superfamily ATP-dependent carboligase
VTVFDVDIPPGIAFIRSLARAGVPVVACSSKRFPAGRFSRYVSGTRRCPSVHDSDRFVAWLVDEMAAGSIDLVAPTSDYVTFCVAEAIEKLDADPHDLGFPPVEALRTCLFKGRFMRALGALGFPTPETATPVSLEEALVAADEIGYPVVIKPRSHVGVGVHRGLVVMNPEGLELAFRPYKLGDAHAAALRHVPDLSMPLVQRYHPLGTVDVVSVSGCLGRDGAVLALGHSRKISQAPRRFGVGTMFEPVPPQPFTDDAVDAVRRLLGSGLFELELLVDRRTGEHRAIDLNARGFGQMSLDIALGNDLPRIWYESVTGTELRRSAPRHPPPGFWHDAVSSYVGFAVRLLRGPERAAIVRHALGRLGTPSVGAAFEWRDPLPGVLFALLHLRHPRAFMRQFLVDVELSPPSASALARGEDGRPWADHSL